MFWASVTFTVPLFVPLEVESVTQDGRPLVVILQFVLEITVTPAIPPAAATLVVDARVAESVGVAPSCVIVTVLVKEPAVKVSVTVLWVVPVFWASVTFTVPLFVPLVGETVAHDWSEVTVHATLEVTVSVFDSPAAATLVIDAGTTESAGVGARGVILNVYLLSLAGVPSEKLLLCPSSISATKVVAPLAWRAAREIDEPIAITSPVAEFFRHPTLAMFGTLTTSFLLDSVITMLLGTSAPLNWGTP